MTRWSCSLAPTLSFEIATNDPQSYHDIVRSISDYRFLHPRYQAQPAQEMRGHSIAFHPPLTLPTNHSSTFLHPQYQAQPAQEMRGHSIDFHPTLTLPTNPSCTSSVRMTTPPHRRNLPPQAFIQDDDVPWLDDHDSDMHLDIDDMSYEVNGLAMYAQDEYRNKQEIGILQCGHGYHADCIRTWLHEKNVCPLCKSKH
ncbi:hypothetical protein ACSQ67_023773 [Phaseolus vulgaris]